MHVCMHASVSLQLQSRAGLSNRGRGQGAPDHPKRTEIGMHAAPYWPGLIWRRGAAQAEGTGTGLTPQISSAYCRMVRSLEKKPLPAVYRMERRVHSSWSR